MAALFLILFTIPQVSIAHHETLSVGGIDWTDTAIESGTGTWAPLDFADGIAKAGILYMKSAEVKFALFENNVWTTYTIETLSGTNNIAEGRLTYVGGDIWLAAYEHSSASDIRFARSTNDGATWSPVIMDASGSFRTDSKPEFQIISATDYILSDGNEYYRSMDSGATWAETACAFPGLSAAIRFVYIISGTGATTKLAAFLPDTGNNRPKFVYSQNNCASDGVPPYLFEGTWNSAVTYSLRDVVDYDGIRYEALRSTVNDIPPSSPSDWATYDNSELRNEATDLNVDGTIASFEGVYFKDGTLYYVSSRDSDRKIWSATGSLSGDTMTWYGTGNDLVTIDPDGGGQPSITSDSTGDVFTSAFDDDTNGFALSDNGGEDWIAGEIPTEFAPFQYNDPTIVMPYSGYSNGVYYYAYQDTDSTLHVLAGLAGEGEELPPNQNTNNPLGQIIGNLNDSWGLDFSILFGIAVVGMVAVAFARVSKTPLLIAIGAFLGLIAANQFGLIPNWVIYVVLFIIVAVAGVTMFERKKDE